MKCPYCGFDNANDANYCQGCGSRMTNQSTAQSGNASNCNSTAPDAPNFFVNGQDYTPLGMWTYFAYQILFAVPIVGFIFLCIFSFGGTKNINLRNFARSYFCVLIIVLVLVLLLVSCNVVASVSVS